MRPLLETLSAVVSKFGCVWAGRDGLTHKVWFSIIWLGSTSPDKTAAQRQGSYMVAMVTTCFIFTIFLTSAGVHRHSGAFPTLNPP